MSNKKYVLNLCFDGDDVQITNRSKSDICLCNSECVSYYIYVYYITICTVFCEIVILAIFLLLYHSENYMNIDCSAPYINLFLILLLNIYLLTTLCFSNLGKYNNKNRIILYERSYLKIAYIINLLFRIWSFISYLYLINNYEENIYNIFNNITNETYTTISIKKIDNKCINDKLLGSLLMSSIILFIVLTCITLYGVVEFIKYCDKHNKERIKKYRESKLTKKEIELKSTKVKLKASEQKIQELETKLRITENKFNDEANIKVAEVLSIL